jgi:DNA topoisomerase-1
MCSNEKDKSEVADTVGCCSLRVEHLTFTPPHTVTFDFLGKDSMRYHNTVELDPRAYANLESFAKGKKPKEEIFDNLTTTLLNEHLKSLMPDLTAKVFRTYNASVTLEKELRDPAKDISKDEHVTTKVNFYNAANREVAILCNHQVTQGAKHTAICTVRMCV